jgi:hypothetical protein
MATGPGVELVSRVEGRLLMAETEGQIARRFRQRMVELGLNVEDVDARAQVGTDTDHLVESADDFEFYRSRPLWVIKRVVEALELNLLEVLGLKCVFCVEDLEPWRASASLPRNEIIRRRREELGLSKEELLAKLGWMQWYVEHSHADFRDPDWAEKVMAEYMAIEDDPDSVEQFSLTGVMHMAEVIEVPPQLLLGVRCDRCIQEEGPSEPLGD